jgi:hypothetical protein
MTPGEPPGTIIMKSRFNSASRLLGVVSLAFLAFGQPVFGAEDKVASPAPAPRHNMTEVLVIENGSFRDRNLRSTPATLRNVINSITQDTRGLNINLVGVEDIVIENVRVQWTRPSRIDNENPNGSIRMLLQALSEASGKFNVRDFGPNDFLLFAGHRDVSRRSVEVFKISPPASVGRPAADIQAEIDMLETELTVYAKRFPAGHPQIDHRTLNIETLKAQLARVSRPPEQSNKDLEQIQDVIRVAMERISPGEAPPELKYHPGTGLMIVVGSETAIDVTRKVVAALRAGPH